MLTDIPSQYCIINIEEQNAKLMVYNQNLVRNRIQVCGKSLNLRSNGA